MKPSLRLAAAAILSVAMLGTTSGASAQVSASSSFDAFAFDLVDLNPHDGIDPGIRFLDGLVSGQAVFRDDNGVLRDWVLASSPGGPIQMLINRPDGQFAGTATTTSASSSIAIENGSGETFTDSFLGFVLAPYTQVTFSIEAIANAINQPGSISFGTVAVNGRITDENGNVVIETDGLSSYLASSDTLSVTLRSAAVELTGSIEFATAAIAQVQAVPEPAPTAMLAAGLVFVGALARRRARSGT